MKKVRCCTRGLDNLKFGKVYDVIYTDKNNYFITIFNDNGYPVIYHTDDFFDVTAKYRNEVIDGILN